MIFRLEIEVDRFEAIDLINVDKSEYYSNMWFPVITFNIKTKYAHSKPSDLFNLKRTDLFHFIQNIEKANDPFTGEINKEKGKTK